MYVKLFASILDSSIWSEDMPTRIVWITMLAMADRDGFVRAVPTALARRANVSIADCENALSRLQASDPESFSPDFEGRRIEKVEGGWQILNYLKYRELKDAEIRREQTRERVRRHRESKRGVTLGNADETPGNPIAEAEADTEASPPPVVPPPSGADAPARPKRGKRPLPDDWEPNDTHRRIAAEEHRDLALEAEKFRDWARANNRRYADWDATFRNWLRSEYGRKPTDTRTPDQRLGWA